MSLIPRFQPSIVPVRVHLPKAQQPGQIRILMEAVGESSGHCGLLGLSIASARTYMAARCWCL
jgi:hypothetical protein